MSMIMHKLPITGPGGRSTAIASIMPPLVSTNPVVADLKINCLRLVLFSMCIKTGAQSRPITRMIPTAVIALIITSAVITIAKNRICVTGRLAAMAPSGSTPMKTKSW